VKNLGPFIHSGRTTRTVMRQVLFALSLAFAAAIWRHGGGAVALVVASLVGACLGEFAWDYRRLGNETTVVAGVIFALLLPSQSPWWIAVVGGAVTTLLGKHVLGGFGNNLFNPAALSRAVLMGVAPSYFFASRWTVDGISQASPLAKEIGLQATTWNDLLLGNHPGTLGESLPCVVVLAGLMLIALRTIDWRVPLTYLASLTLLALVLPASDQIEGHAPWLAGNPLPHLLAGGSLVTGFFLLTDPVTSPIAAGGRIAFAAIAGAYTMFIRFYTPYPDAAALAVLLGNALVPTLDRFFPGGRTA
jgi:electron transport complex protein RnfD